MPVLYAWTRRWIGRLWKLLLDALFTAGWHRRQPCHGWARHPGMPPALSQTKPPWVRQEIVQLAALDAHAGCRRLADIFNRRHAGGDGMTVGKSFVATLLRQQAGDILRRRCELRRRRYVPGRRNQVWGVDNTGKTDATGQLHVLLGVIDHGTRRCLHLEALKDKASITILRSLLDVIERFGAPRALRTDNEAVFNSRLFRFALAWLGIRHQTIEPHCPWQNGRIERFFGTLKASLDHWSVADRQRLNTSLAQFRFWYNRVRPHQHLQGRTPAEVWNGIDVYRCRLRGRRWFEAWDGRLQGEYLQA